MFVIFIFKYIICYKNVTARISAKLHIVQNCMQCQMIWRYKQFLFYITSMSTFKFICSDMHTSILLKEKHGFIKNRNHVNYCSALFIILLLKLPIISTNVFLKWTRWAEILIIETIMQWKIYFKTHFWEIAFS